MIEGWIKLYRSLLQSHIFENEKLLKVWTWCLLKATHCERIQQVGRQQVLLKPGQFVTGRHKASVELGLPPSTVWEYLKILEADNTINIKSNNKFSIVTVVNWALYQYEEENSDNKSNNTSNSKSTTNRQQIDTNKNIKNDKNEKNNINISLQISNLRSRYSEKQLKIIDEYFEILQWTRRNGKIANSVILKIYQEWEKYPIEKVIYALHIYNNNPKHHDKKENYCYGIMRNTTMEEIEEYKRKQGGVNSEKHGGNISRGSNGYGHNKQSHRAGKFDNIEIPGVITG